MSNGMQCRQSFVFGLVNGMCQSTIIPEFAEHSAERSNSLTYSIDQSDLDTQPLPRIYQESNYGQSIKKSNVPNWMESNVNKSHIKNRPVQTRVDSLFRRNSSS